MHRNILLVIALLLALNVKAIDTLTVRQVYSYNVGDTMDYKTWTYSLISLGSGQDIGYQDSSFERRIVTSKTYSTRGDTIFISFNQGAINLTITNLDSVAVYYASNYVVEDTSCYVQSIFDTTAYTGIISNSININCFGGGNNYRFSNGLGRTYYLSGGGDPVDGYQYTSETLVYYSNGQTRVGTPMEDLNGSKNIHYMPLPEECASWTRVAYAPNGPPGPTTVDVLVFTEQIITGTKYAHNGYNYIEMVYSCLYASDYYIPDTVIGYFYNDTLKRMVFYTPEIDSIPRVLCDFTMLPGENCYSTGVIVVDSVLIGNQYRTRWNCSDEAFGANPTIISGIGHLYGLMKVKYDVSIDYYDNPPDPYEIDGELTCFSVCGQTLYPNDTAANCAVLTGLQQINLNNTEIKLYPSVNDGKFMLSWINSHTDDELQLFDLTGRLVGQCQIYNTLTTYQCNKLSKGMYLWRAVTNNVPVQQGRFIVE